MTINTVSQWTRLVAGVAVVFALFHWTAQALGSDRGQAGILIGLLVVTATLVVEAVLFGQRPVSAARSLGLGLPRAGGLAAAVAVCVALLLVVPIFAKASGASPTFRSRLVVASARPLRASRRRRGGVVSRLPLRTPASRSIVLASGGAVDPPVCRSSPRLVLDDAVADRRGGAAALNRALSPAGASFRVGRWHHLGAGTPSLRRPRHRQGDHVL